MVDPEDVDGIESAIRELEADAEQRRSLGQAGREFVVSEYDRRVLARRYADALAEVI